MNLLERLINRGKQKSSRSLETEINEGNQAANLLRDTIFTEVVDTMRQSILTEWEHSSIRDIEGQEKLRMMIEVLNSVVKNIETKYTTGVMAQKQKDAAEKTKSKK